MRKRLTAILLSLALALGLAPKIPVNAAEKIEFYEDGGVRTGLKSIEIAPYTYYNVGDQDGGTVVDLNFLQDLVKTELLGKWSQLAEDIFRVHPRRAWFNKNHNRDFEYYFNNENATGQCTDISNALRSTSFYDSGGSNRSRIKGLTYTTSLADVRTKMSEEMDAIAGSGTIV